MGETHDRREAVVIRHVAFEDEGGFAGPLRAAGYALRRLDAGLDDLSPARDADLLLVMGGPLSANDERAYPWLAQELRLIADRMAADRPTLGVCLGAQLMARAAGAVVRPGTREIGIAPLQLTEAGRSGVLTPYAQTPLAFHWHGDTFELPAGATLLASTVDCAHQAFTLGPNALALQFHPELDAGGFERWLIGHAAELRALDVDPVPLREAVRVAGPALRRRGTEMLDRWLHELAEDASGSVVGGGVNPA